MRLATRWHFRHPQSPPGPFQSALDDTPRSKPVLEDLRFGHVMVTHDNEVRLLVGGHEVLPVLLEAIARAEHSVHLEAMLFFNDDAGYQIRDALMRRLDETRGKLKVRVLYDFMATTLGDPFLSKGTNPLQVSTFMAPLRGAGAEVIDSSFVGDKDPARLERLSDFIPIDLRASIVNFPYEVRRAYKRLNVTALKLFGSPRMQRPIARFLSWCEKHESALAEQLTPHRLISRYAVHDHRKIFVIDGALAFCGGMNIGQEYLYRHPYDPTVPVHTEIERPDNPEPWPKWHDTCCLLRGPVVNTLQEVFMLRFERCGGTPPRGRELGRCFPVPPTLEAAPCTRSGGMKVAVSLSVPGRPSGIEREALAMLSTAQERVLLCNPYLVRLGFVGALGAAARRGVAVRTLLPCDLNDSMVHQGYMRSWYPFLLDSGVEVREYQNHFTHTKALTVDGRRTLLGSFNYNNRSSALDFECAIVVDDHSFARETEGRLYDDEVSAGLAHQMQSSTPIGDVAEILASLATFEVWETFL